VRSSKGGRRVWGEDKQLKGGGGVHQIGLGFGLVDSNDAELLQGH
jgi:hypothetical protein